MELDSLSVAGWFCGGARKEDPQPQLQSQFTYRNRNEIIFLLAGCCLPSGTYGVLPACRALLTLIQTREKKIMKFHLFSGTILYEYVNKGEEEEEEGEKEDDFGLSQW
ncbi:hypothetical protein RUM43_007866 [Polyplax serrata]|uniref:Uncharacterized protein n=1 Tax=Polyplax serrata TaxID=468196 RepID=A0AAN8PMU1_POLSC